MVIPALLVAGFFVSPQTYGAGGQLLIDRFDSEPSNGFNVPFRSRTISFNYTGGTVTFSSCETQACTWAIDDAAQLVVTRPGGSQITRDFVSNTQDKPAANVTDMFLVGVNSVTIHMIDHFGPVRGLPRALYLIESSAPLPAPAPAVKQLPVSKKYNGHPLTENSKDPVNTYTGSFLYSHTDLAIAGRGPAPSFSRSYDSTDTLNEPFSLGWTHSYNMLLVRPDETTSDIVLIGAQGRADRFTFSGGNYSAPASIYTSLVKNSNGTYTVTHKDLTTWSFDEAGKLQRITDRFGNQSTLGYDGNGRLVSVSDPAGRGSLGFAYDGSGRLTSVSDWANRTVQYGYDGNGRLTTVTDRENKVTTYGYDPISQRLATIRDARNNTVVTNVYDTQGRVTSQKDARGLTTGQQTTFAYNTNGDGTKTTVITYPKTSFEPNWNFVEEDTYDTQGRIVKKVSKPVAASAEWITQEYTYDASGNRASFKDGRGNTTKYCYDVDYAGAAIAGSRGNLTRLIAPAPTAGAALPVTLYKYDAKNNLVQTVAPKGVASTTSTSCTTNLASAVNLLYATDSTYDTATQTKLTASTSRYTEPGVGQKTALTTFEYTDPANPGRLTSLVTPRGNTGASPDYTYGTVNTYFASGPKAGLLESSTTAVGAKTTYDYDSVGRRIAATNPKGNISGAVPAEHTWQYAYDNEDRPRFTKAPAPVVGQGQLVTETRYDAVGNKTAVLDPNGQVTRYVYDERDSLQEVHQTPNIWTDPAVNPTGLITTAYQYDHLGNLTRVTRAKADSANERVTDYTFDGLGRARGETQYPNWPATTSPLVTVYTYDKNNNRASLKDPLLKTTTYAYDTLDQLTTITYNNTSTPNVTYNYDVNGNRIKMIDGTGTTNYTYDEQNRLLSVQSPGPKTVGYRYDLDGNRAQIIYPDNTVVAYSFDKASRLTTVVDWSSRTTTYDYFIDGQPKTVNHTINGTSAHYTYDNAGRLTQVWNKHGTGSNTVTRHTYQMDAVGNRTHTDEVLTDGYDPGPIDPDRQGTIDYTYDRLYRLTHEDRQLPFPQDEETLDYTYDPAGNRLTETIDNVFPETTTFTYDRADRLKTADGDLDETYTLDANGNMTKRGSNGNITFTYDQANRIIRSSGGKIRYTYDGDGKRTKIQEGSLFISTKDTYIYDTNRDLPVVLQDIYNKYVWGLDLLYAVDADNEPGIYHFDGLGSMRAITDVRTPDTPRVQMYEEYRAFGVQGYSNRLYDQPFKFAGEQFDEDFWDAELVYLRARYYDPVIGRFMSRDTFAGDTMQPQSLNRYTYVRNNPVNSTDPSGMMDVEKAGWGIAKVAGGTVTTAVGVGVLLGTGVTGVGAVGGTAVMAIGMMSIGSGLADITTSFTGQETLSLGPIGMVTSHFTSDEDHMLAAEIADGIFPGSSFKHLDKAGKLYAWLRTLDAAGNLQNLNQLLAAYVNRGIINGPAPVFGQKQNK